MPKYRVYGRVVGTKFLGEIDAESKEDAEEKAFDEFELGISLCHQCAREVDDAEIDVITVSEVVEKGMLSAVESVWPGIVGKEGCARCGGKGYYAYDENHSCLCPDCCPHDGGWWELGENHQHPGMMCCSKGCGFIREKTPEERRGVDD